MSLTNKRVLGVDPGLRHTGACLLTGAGIQLDQIDTGKLHWIDATRHLRAEFKKLLAVTKPDAIAFERQLAVGAQSSSLLWHVQMTLLEVIADDLHGIPIVMPLPIQLQSFIRKRMKIEYKSDSELVKIFKETTGTQGRVSIHKVDAYYLTQLATQVLAGEWKFKPPAKDPEPLPWRTTNGEGPNPD